MYGRFLSFFMLYMALSAGALAQPNYVSSRIPAPEWPDEVIVADMNGNGRQDLIVPGWSAQAGRELGIFLQQADGRYPAQASRQIRIRPDIIAVSLADVRPMPGNELLLISNSAVYSLSTMIPGYENNLEKLFDWDFIASVPDRQRTLFFPPAQDLTGNGHPDLLLPGRRDYGLFTSDESGAFRLLHRFVTDNEELDPSELPVSSGRFSTEFDINQRDGLIVRIVPHSNSAFEDFVEDWREAGAGSHLLHMRDRIPGAVTANMNPQTGKDIVYTDIGDDFRARINILSRLPEGGFPEQPQWRGSADAEGDYRLEDLNGNGLMDLVRIVEEDGDWDLYFHINRDGSFEFDQPDQRMRFSGYDLRLSVQDLDGNGRPELSVTYYTIPATAAIRDSSINRTQLIYGSRDARDGQVFNARPDSRLEESFSADAVRGLSEPINLQADINNDGRIDALYLSGDGTLAARSIDSTFRFSSNPFWQHVPDRTVIGFDVQDLNGNGRPDILLYHSTATTVLVSSP